MKLCPTCRGEKMVKDDLEIKADEVAEITKKLKVVGEYAACFLAALVPTPFMIILFVLVTRFAFWMGDSRAIDSLPVAAVIGAVIGAICSMLVFRDLFIENPRGQR